MASAATTQSTTPTAPRPVVQSRSPRARAAATRPTARPAPIGKAMAAQPAKWFLFTNGPKGKTVGTRIEPYSRLPNRARATIA